MTTEATGAAGGAPAAPATRSNRLPRTTSSWPVTVVAAAAVLFLGVPVLALVVRAILDGSLAVVIVLGLIGCGQWKSE